MEYMQVNRANGRAANELRPVKLTRGVMKHAHGSCLAEFGDTRVLCAATIEEGVPGWRKGAKAGWVTAEYAMLPASTGKRCKREHANRKGRSMEIERLIGRSLRTVVNMKALGQLGDFEDPEENGTTFLENAIIKAQAAVEETGLMAIADDSGLVVDALDGEPGVYSARYAGVHGDDAANNAKLLVNLEGVADEDRTARFMSVVALIDTDGLVTYGEGACEGVIAHEGRGDHGFGYDPLFLPVDTPGKTMAELTADEKNAISHRFHALEHLSAKLTGEE